MTTYKEEGGETVCCCQGLNGGETVSEIMSYTAEGNKSATTLLYYYILKSYCAKVNERQR